MPKVARPKIGRCAKQVNTKRRKDGTSKSSSSKRSSLQSSEEQRTAVQNVFNTPPGQKSKASALIDASPLIDQTLAVANCSLPDASFVISKHRRGMLADSLTEIGKETREALDILTTSKIGKKLGLALKAYLPSICDQNSLLSSLHSSLGVTTSTSQSQDTANVPVHATCTEQPAGIAQFVLFLQPKQLKIQWNLMVTYFLQPWMMGLLLLCQLAQLAPTNAEQGMI
jgi:hypothetical protein